MNLSDLPRVPPLPPGFYYRVAAPKADDPRALRVQVRRDTGPPWWSDRRSKAVVSVAVDLSAWRDAASALTWAARSCVFRRGYESNGKRAWLVQHEATAFLGDHR